VCSFSLFPVGRTVIPEVFPRRPEQPLCTNGNINLGTLVRPRNQELTTLMGSGGPGSGGSTNSETGVDSSQQGDRNI